MPKHTPAEKKKNEKAKADAVKKKAPVKKGKKPLFGKKAKK